MKIQDLIAKTERSSKSMIDSEDDYTTIYNIIKEHCQPFLEMIDYDLYNNVIYRGMDRFEDPISLMKVRKDRKPLATNVEVHRLADNYFKKKFNISARSGSVFVTSSFSTASEYGRPVVCFPVGEFKFVWSPNTNDMYGLFVGQMETGIRKLAATDNKDAAQEYVDSVLDYHQYTDENLVAAINSHNEIMIECDYYIVVQTGVFQRMAKYSIGIDDEVI